MADIADESRDYQERLNAHALANRPAHLPGPNRCMRCGEANDRRQDGYAVCSDCVADD